MAAARCCLPDKILAAMHTPCYTCAEIKAGKNEPALADLLRYALVEDRYLILRKSKLRITAECRLCSRASCRYHSNWALPRIGRDRVCRECFALNYRFNGLCGRWTDDPPKPFRRRWLLFRWRLTKRRLVERLRISRVVELTVLPKDLAEIVATYAVN